MPADFDDSAPYRLKRMYVRREGFMLREAASTRCGLSRGHRRKMIPPELLRASLDSIDQATRVYFSPAGRTSRCLLQSALFTI